MRQNFFYFIVAAALIMGCGSRGGSNVGSSDSDLYKIKLTTEADGKIILGIVGSGVATIDWGDSSEKDVLTIGEKWPQFEHTYPGASTRTITVTGDSITGFGCSDSGITNLDVSRCAELTIFGCYNNQLTSLDVSKNLALTYLKCTNNQLTSLDLSKNTALTTLDCENNQLSFDALNALFGTLSGNNVEGEKKIYIRNNPGEESFDKSIAESKGWSLQ
jgi:hypothetical protein